MKKLSLVFPVLLALIIALSSCTVSEDMSISPSVRSSSTDIVIKDFFAEVLMDQADLLTGTPSDVIDDTVRDFTKGLAESGHAENVLLKKNGTNDYTIDFDFGSIGDVIAALSGENAGQTVIRETADSLEFHLDLDNYSDLESAIPFLKDPNFEVYGPVYNEGMTAEEYYDMISYLLSEEAPEAIENSRISFTIHTPKAVRTVEGAEKIDSRTVFYEFPLISFLILDEPLSFRVTW